MDLRQIDHLTLLNSPILTAFGEFRFEFVANEQVRSLVSRFKQRSGGIRSAIGHKETAELLTELFDYTVERNRMEYKQQVNDVALVFRLRRRPAEGKVLTIEEMKKIGWDFGLLTRLA